MRLIDRRCLIVGAIAAVHVLVGVALDTLFQETLRTHRSETAEIVYCSFVACQGSILAFWAAMGGKASPWRFVLAMVGGGAWCWLAAEMRAAPEIAIWSFIRFAQMFVVSSLLLSVRFVGLELSCADTNLSAPEPYRFQFSLRSMLEWTTAVACLLALLHYLPPWEVFIALPLVLAGLLVGTSTLVAVACFWIALSERSMVVRIGLMIVGVGVHALAFEVLQGLGFWQFGLFFFCQTVLLVGSIWPVRLAGYRLIWRRRVVL